MKRTGKLTWRGNRKQAVKQASNALRANWSNEISNQEFDNAISSILRRHCSFTSGNVKDNHEGVRARLIKNAQTDLENKVLFWQGD